MNQDAGEPVKIMETRDHGLVATAKSLLDGAGIEYTVTNEFSQNVMVAGQLSAMEIIVKPKDAGAAQFILRGLMRTDETRQDDGAPPQDQPFGLRLLIALGIVAIPIILAILYALQN